MTTVQAAALEHCLQFLRQRTHDNVWWSLQDVFPWSQGNGRKAASAKQAIRQLASGPWLAMYGIEYHSHSESVRLVTN